MLCCKRLRLGLLFLAAVFLCNIVDARTWTSRSGKYRIEATFESLDGTAAVLKRENGTTLRVPLAKLSPLDVRYIRTQVAAKKKPSSNSSKGRDGRPAKMKVGRFTALDPATARQVSFKLDGAPSKLDLPAAASTPASFKPVSLGISHYNLMGPRLSAPAARRMAAFATRYVEGKPKGRYEFGLRWYDTKSGKLVGGLALSRQSRAGRLVGISPDGSLAAVNLEATGKLAVDERNMLQFVSLTKQKLLATWSLYPDAVQKGLAITHVAFPDATHMFTAYQTLGRGPDTFAYYYTLWSLADGKAVYELQRSKHVIRAITPDQRYAILLEYDKQFVERKAGNNTMVFWDIAKGETAAVFKVDAIPDQFAISPDGRRIAILQEDTDSRDWLEILDLKTGASPGRSQLPYDCLRLNWAGNGLLMFNGRLRDVQAKKGMNHHLYDVQKKRFIWRLGPRWKTFFTGHHGQLWVISTFTDDINDPAYFAKIDIPTALPKSNGEKLGELMLTPRGFHQPR